jgi:hypothetical protein
MTIINLNYCALFENIQRLSLTFDAIWLGKMVKTKIYFTSLWEVGNWEKMLDNIKFKFLSL